MTTIAGGTIAALVAADAAARRGKQVDLYLPERGVGGGFQPLHVGGLRLELGVRLLELSYGAEEVGGSPPLSEYCPGPHGHRPYISEIRRFLAELLEPDLVEVVRPRMFVNGGAAADIFFTVDLSSLRGTLTFDQRQAIESETWRILGQGQDAGILSAASGADLWSMSLEAASLANHGPTFHRLFVQQVCQKILPGGSSTVVAALRRKVWMPLFHPRTLWEAVSGRPVGFIPDRRFHTVREGTGEVVRRLLVRLEAAPNVAVTRVPRLEEVWADHHGVRLQFAGGAITVGAQRPILGFSPEELFPAGGAPYSPERLPLAIGWVAIPEDDLLDLPSMMFVVDGDLPAYRVNDGGSAGPDGTRLVSLEFSREVSAGATIDAARRTLEIVGILRPGGAVDLVHQVRAPAFAAPNGANYTAFEVARAAFNNLGLDADIIGGAVSFGADSLNEQIIQGLQAGDTAE